MPAANKIAKAEWKHKLEQWVSSGKTMADWCREQNISIHTFYYRRSQLMSPVKVAGGDRNKFIELIDKPFGMSGISIDCCGVTVHLASDFHPASLIQCLQTLRKI